MDYQRIYDQLISRAKNRAIEGYTERHHILPRALGGDDSERNIAVLTAREHYLAHWLLFRIHRCAATAFAWHAMSMNKNGQRYTSRSFAYSRAAWAREMARINTGRDVSSETRRRQSAAKAGRDPWNKGLKIASTPSKQELAYNQSPKVCIGCGCEISYKARKNKYCSYDCSRSHIESWISKGHKRAINSGTFRPGHELSEETKARISARLKGLKRPKSQCPNCGKIGAAGLMKRWHFDNCRQGKEL